MLRMPIDKKSLFYNIKNDNRKGHTATVATPLKQGNVYNKGLQKLLEIPMEVSKTTLEEIVGLLLINSRALVKINGVYIFDKLAVNGVAIKNTPAFCLYIREEIDPNNCHCGRMKVHYPMSFTYSDLNVFIDNKAVMKSISECLGNYAFVVEAFEYDEINKILNFDTVVVGKNNTPYSKVFANGRYGVNKTKQLSCNFYEAYDTEILSLKESLGYDNVNADNYLDLMLDSQLKARKICENHLIDNGVSQLRKVYEKYPNALYDFEYYEEGKKRYVILKFTSSSIFSFNLSIDEIMFCQQFSESVCLCFVNNINSEYRVKVYNADKLNDMRKSIKSITYIDMEE